jgi:L-threonylcarbamoyladenylate synthase
MKTTVITGEDISFAVDTIKNGGLVAVPTETVYGLAADGMNEKAVAMIYEVKGRPETKPINLLVQSMEQAEKFCIDISPKAYLLAEKFWPGPLTMIFKKQSVVPDIVTAGGDTVGVRCPCHEKTLNLIRLTDCPLATPSANFSGMPSPKSADQVLGYFDGKIPCLIDGGECAVGVESTILDMTGPQVRILRRGGLEKAAIEAALGEKIE